MLILRGVALCACQVPSDSLTPHNEQRLYVRSLGPVRKRGERGQAVLNLTRGGCRIWYLRDEVLLERVDMPTCEWLCTIGVVDRAAKDQGRDGRAWQFRWRARASPHHIPDRACRFGRAASATPCGRSLMTPRTSLGGYVLRHGHGGTSGGERAGACLRCIVLLRDVSLHRPLRGVRTDSHRRRGARGTGVAARVPLAAGRFRRAVRRSPLPAWGVGPP